MKLQKTRSRLFDLTLTSVAIIVIVAACSHFRLARKIERLFGHDTSSTVIKTDAQWLSKIKLKKELENNRDKASQNGVSNQFEVPQEYKTSLAVPESKTTADSFQVKNSTTNDDEFNFISELENDKIETLETALASDAMSLPDLDDSILFEPLPPTLISRDRDVSDPSSSKNPTGLHNNSDNGQESVHVIPPRKSESIDAIDQIANPGNIEQSWAGHMDMSLPMNSQFQPDVDSKNHIASITNEPSPNRLSNPDPTQMFQRSNVSTGSAFNKATVQKTSVQRTGVPQSPMMNKDARPNESLDTRPDRFRHSTLFGTQQAKAKNSLPKFPNPFTRGKKPGTSSQTQSNHVPSSRAFAWPTR